MAVEILMPELGESVHEGTVSRWLKKEGDYVKEDEPVVEIMTDKVNTELQAPASGVLSKIIIPEGEQVQVFAAMGIIDDGKGAAATTSAPEAKAPSAEAPAAATAEAPKAEAAPLSTSANGERKWYTPVVRSIAKQNQVSDSELAGIAGTGHGGRVTKKDLEGYLAGGRSSAPAATTAPKIEVKPSTTPLLVGPDQEVTPLVGMRKMIADAMVRSAAVPTVSTVTQVDVTSMVEFRDRNKDAFLAQYGVKLTYTPFFVKALAETLLELPLLNASLQDGQVIKTKGVHIGVAVALGAKGDEGLIVPVIRDCHTKSLIDIARDLDAIAKKARANQLSVADVQGGTFTLTNPGTYGALFGTPMINAPQSGILGAYGITKQPVIVNDMIAIRSIMHLVLTYDHRLIDGLIAGKFLAGVRDRLQSFDFFK
jgi:pyruvate/2-oxoglutarate dehydrogenase complex dihydrolipoamide acyltransferase (E2) component